MAEQAPDTAPSAPEAAKSFVAAHNHGALATLSQAVPGYPFGSVVPYDVEPGGAVVLLISRISQHYKNLVADAKASLMVLQRGGEEDPQAFGRLTLLADFREIAPSELESVSSAYYERHPKSPARALAHDFVFFRGHPVRIRWIGGFGDIRWIDATDYSSAPFDHVAYEAEPILRHMNEDHRDALAELARHHSAIDCTPEQCLMAELHRTGFSIRVRTPDGTQQVALSFAQPVQTATEVRNQLITMLKEARA
ncbi:MAG: DUF2470 domain-containing protein [Bdellovibrionales bacterium]|nr:DUF2470 domain-containing protein [Bdellovibrionales bacterium]